MERKFEIDYESVISASHTLGIDKWTLNYHLRNGIHDAMWDGDMLMLSRDTPEQKWALDFLLERGMIFFLNNRYYTTPYGWYAYERMSELFGSWCMKWGREIRLRRFFSFPYRLLRNLFSKQH